MAKDNSFSITYDKFYQGYAPLAFTNSLTETGGAGAASVMGNVDVLTDRMTQGPGLASLTNGTQAGVVSESINYIVDRAISTDTTYAIGDTKLYQLSSTAVTSSGAWPHTITGSTSGQSIQVLKGALYYFYNKSSGGDIGKFDLSSTFDDDWGSTVPTGAAALQKAIHPSTSKEDLMVFGNGQYVGIYIVSTNNIYPTKLDFGSGTVVSDVVYNQGFWYIAVNSGVTGTNRTTAEIYLWDGAGITTSLADETAVGNQRIGFLYVLNGIVYVAYQDISSSGFIIGYVNGKAITPLARFTGDLPTFAQKTLYKGNITFLSSGLTYTAGAFVDTLPFQLSQHADAGYANATAIAAPFGTPIIASNDGGSNFKLAQFSGYDTNCSWKSIVTSVVGGLNKGYIDRVTVLTKSLASGASCSLTIEANQASVTSTAQTITGTGITRHEFTTLGLSAVEDFRVALNWSGGSTSNDCAIRKIIVNGHFAEG